MNVDGNQIQNTVFDFHQQIADSLSAGAYHDRFVEAHLEDAAEDLKELRELRRIADAAQKQAELAEKQAKAAQAEAENAKKDSIEAQKDSRTANLIAFVSMLIALVSLVKQFIG